MDKDEELDKDEDLVKYETLDEEYKELKNLRTKKDEDDKVLNKFLYFFC